MSQRQHISDQQLALLKEKFPSLLFRNNEPLARYTTVKIGGPAELFCEISIRDVLIQVLQFCHQQSIPVTILGWGANTLIADRGLSGLVIKNKCSQLEILSEVAPDEYLHPKLVTARHQSLSAQPQDTTFSDLDYSEEHSQRIRVRMDAGVSLPLAINQLLQQGITGLQWYSRIPASIGGAVYNTIHGGTHFINEVVESVDVFTTQGQLTTIPHHQLEAGYDYSRFHHSQEQIISVLFQLYKGDVDKARFLVSQWATLKKNQPQNSLGCVFQNISAAEQEQQGLPTNSVGFIIDHVLGLKGQQFGGARISEKHAAFIENTGTATAADYLIAIKTIMTQTQQKLGISLVPEIFFLGFTEQELAGVRDK